MVSFRANTVETRAAYVAISRARSGASIYTDSCASLLDVLGLPDGAQVGAIDETMGRDASLRIADQIIRTFTTEDLNFRPIIFPPSTNAHRIP